MAFNGSGTFNRIHNWVTDKANSIKITASRMDAEDDGFATGLSNCITKDGQTTITADIPMAGFVLTGLGAAAADGESVRYEQVLSTTDSITAGTTQTQAGATALTAVNNRVTTSGTDGDGVKLPSAVAGLSVVIFNADAAQTIQVWPNTSDAIDGGSADAVDGREIPPGGFRRYIATDATNWRTAGGRADIPAFLAYNSATDANVTGNAVTATVDFDTESFDTTLNFSGDTFTAPIGGKYHFSTSVHLVGYVKGTNTRVSLVLSTSNGDIYLYDGLPEESTAGALLASINGSADVDMDALDTATIKITVSGGTQVVDVYGSATRYTFFSGHYIG